MTAASKKTATLLEFEGSNFFRCRLLLSTLSGRAVRIRNIRSREENPGLNEHEASLVRLFDKITNGSKIEVSETGTALFYQPGLLVGGSVEHDCCTDRGIGYYLEPLLALGAFCKNPLNVSLRGVTNSRTDPSPDLLKNSALPILKRYFLVDDGLELKVKKRCAELHHHNNNDAKDESKRKQSLGLVQFRCPLRKTLRSLTNIDQGKIKRIRGVAWATRVSPAFTNRMIESAKGVLLKFLPDVYIYSDHLTGASSGQSPGFGLVLTAETTTGALLSAEIVSNPKDSPDGPSIPEDLGVKGAHLLLEEIYRGGFVDSTCQSLQLLLMCLTQRNVSKVLIGPLSTYSVHFLRHIKDFMEVTFKIENMEIETKENESGEEEELKMGAPKIEISCLGVGYTNISKRTI